MMRQAVFSLLLVTKSDMNLINMVAPVNLSQTDYAVNSQAMVQVTKTT